MKNSIVFLSLLFLFAPLAHAGETGSDSAKETAAAESMQFDKYWMVFLVRPEAPKDHGKERNAELQREHLAHLTWLWEEGYALIAGPFGGKPEDPLRGIVLLRGDLEEERARELAEMDPRVKAGQLEVEIRDWYTGAGYMVFPKTPE